MYIDLTKLIVALLGVLASLACRYVIPYFIERTDAEKRSKIFFWAKLAVEAAEKIFNGPGLGAQKKEYVKEFLEERGYKLNEKEIDIAIESAVLEMQHAMNG